MLWPGEKIAWDILLSLDPKDVEGRAHTVFSPGTSTFKLICLGQEILVSLRDQEISSPSSSGAVIVNELGQYSRLSILRYLIHAKNQPLSGKLVKPSDLPGGDFFLKGSHVLPVEKIISRFENDLSGFLKTGEALGGIRQDYGDASVSLFPFPRVPVYIILWAGDDEFPSQASLLFDSICSKQMATDILWSTAMMTIEMLLFSSPLLR
jgi:hypothetical protein